MENEPSSIKRKPVRAEQTQSIPAEDIGAQLDDLMSGLSAEDLEEYERLFDAIKVAEQNYMDFAVRFGSVMTAGQEIEYRQLIERYREKSRLLERFKYAKHARRVVFSARDKLLERYYATQ